MKKLILLLLLITGTVFAQKDEIYDWSRSTLSLTGYRQAFSADVYQKNIVIDNSASDSAVYLCKIRDGVVDTTASYYRIAAGEERTFFNFTDKTFYLKGTSGKSVVIYILKGTGRGVMKSPGASSSSGLSKSDSLKYYTIYNLDTSKVMYENQNNNMTGNLTVKGKVAISNLSYSYLPDGSMMIMSDTCLIIVNPKYNKRLDTWSELVDTACYRIRFTPLGEMIMMWNDLTGTSYGMDSTGKWSLPGDLTVKNDFINFSGRYLVLGSNSAATLGVALNSTADGVARLRNAGVSADATLQLASLILTGVPTYADNAAALAGGLTAGKIYRTSTGVLMITY